MKNPVQNGTVSSVNLCETCVFYSSRKSAVSGREDHFCDGFSKQRRIAEPAGECSRHHEPNNYIHVSNMMDRAWILTSNRDGKVTFRPSKEILESEHEEDKKISKELQTVHYTDAPVLN